MSEAGVQEVETYVASLHNTAAQSITTRPIVDLCIVAICSIPGSLQLLEVAP